MSDINILKRKFGEAIRLRRKQCNLTIFEVAKEVGITSVYLSDIELGKSAPPIKEKITKLEKCLNCEPGELLGLAFIEKRLISLELEKENIDQYTVAISLALAWNNFSKQDYNELTNWINNKIKYNKNTNLDIIKIQELQKQIKDKFKIDSIFTKDEWGFPMIIFKTDCIYEHNELFILICEFKKDNPELDDLVTCTDIDFNTID